MTAPRLEIDLNRLHHNARTLVERLGRAGIAITGVSKATLGLPEIVATWIAAGVPSIGESRIASIEALHRSAIPVPLLMVRSPMLHEVERVVAHAAISCNSEAVVLRALAAAARAQGLRHGVLLMVELGDLREGILPADLEGIVRLTLALPNLQLLGLATNLGCQHGVAPDASNMAELSALTSAQEARFGIRLPWCSGGNSANLPWLAAGGVAGRINHLRLGEALLLGREPLSRSAIPGLYTDAITLVAEVIESKLKPMRPWGSRQRSSFDHRPAPPSAEAERRWEEEPQLAMRTILALGEQDADPASLSAAGLSIEGASSDHLIVTGANPALAVGDEQRFQIGYSSLLRAMTSPFVARCFV
ncbi:MAG: alanine/ornithine racemase family PLP-dependent enzyme [Synechococcaceae cyanobacterium]